MKKDKTGVETMQGVSDFHLLLYRYLVNQEEGDSRQISINIYRIHIQTGLPTNFIYNEIFILLHTKNIKIQKLVLSDQYRHVYEYRKEEAGELFSFDENMIDPEDYILLKDAEQISLNISKNLNLLEEPIFQEYCTLYLEIGRDSFIHSIDTIIQNYINDNSNDPLRICYTRQKELVLIGVNKLLTIGLSSKCLEISDNIWNMPENQTNQTVKPTLSESPKKNLISTLLCMEYQGLVKVHSCWQKMDNESNSRCVISITKQGYKILQLIHPSLNSDTAISKTDNSEHIDYRKSRPKLDGDRLIFGKKNKLSILLTKYERVFCEYMFRPNIQIGKKIPCEEVSLYVIDNTSWKENVVKFDQIKNISDRIYKKTIKHNPERIFSTTQSGPNNGYVWRSY